MKRILFSLAVCLGMLAASPTGASAAMLCHDDPTLQVAVPGVTTAVSVTIPGSNVWATSGSGSTSFGFTLGTP
ncbi:MAG TPA: hypothetical protein VER07_06195 [Candidatus Polarisedimenticolia bacterium]|nr:hypothetical protein [Candidatus Polarisedimenticolia bacterium]